MSHLSFSFFCLARFSWPFFRRFVGPFGLIEFGWPSERRGEGF